MTQRSSKFISGSKAKDDFQVDALLSASDWLVFKELRVDSLIAPASINLKSFPRIASPIVMSVGVRDRVRGLEMNATDNATDSNVMN